MNPLMFNVVCLDLCFKIMKDDIIYCFQELFRRGHEISTHSITHDNDEKYWQNGTQDTWQSEMGGMRDLLAKWANIPKDQIYGSRAPLLKLGGNR